MTDFRLLQLGEKNRGEVLPKGQPLPLAPGVLVTLADADGNVMVEYASGAGKADVKVDGKQVYEVAHARPLQVIEVDKARFVLMPPYGAFVQDCGDKDATAAVKKPRAKAKAVKAEPRRLRLVYVAVPAFLALLGIGLSLVPEQKPAEAVTEVAAEPEAEAGAGEEAEAGAEAEADPTSAPASAPAPAAVPVDPIVIVAPASAPAAASSPAPAYSPAPASTPAPAPAAAPATAVKALPPAREAEVRSLAESYQLEGGFDPEGAARKLKALKKQVPANARVQKDIDRALKAVGG